MSIILEYYSWGNNILCAREQQKRLGALHLELEKAKQEGFVSNRFPDNSGNHSKKKLLAVLGIITKFDRRKNREAIRKAWMPTGTTLLPCAFYSFDNALQIKVQLLQLMRKAYVFSNWCVILSAKVVCLCNMWLRTKVETFISLIIDCLNICRSKHLKIQFYWLSSSIVYPPHCMLFYAGSALKKLEEENGIVVRFVIGRRYLL